MQANSSIKGLSASPDIHYNNSLNTEVQKQNEPKQRNCKQKLSNQLFWGFIAIRFFNKPQVFLSFNKNEL